MKEPTVSNLTNGVRYGFQDYQVTVTTQRVSDGRGTITGDIDIETTAPAIPPDLYFGRYDFMSIMSRQRLAAYLEKQYSDPPWMQILEKVSRKAVTSIRRGDRMVEINSADEVSDVQFDVFPFLQTNQPTTLFGDGATGKSYIALVLAVAVKAQWHDNPIGLTVNMTEPGDVVWLDYETSEDDFHRRLNRLVRGMGLPETSITYRRCSRVMADEIEDIALMVNSHEPRLVVIDSIGAACAGDLHGSEAPTRFFNALRQLSGAKMLLFHTNREQQLYGNRFFWNFSRHAWEVKKQQVEGDDTISVGIYHRKANETKLFEPVGFNFIFGPTTTGIEKADIASIPELERHLPVWRRMQEHIKHYGAMTVTDLAEELNTTEGTIRDAANKHKGLFVKVENKWGLLA